ncbi:MAG TPA: ATP-binding cassette domain-containing protein [Chloroflexota bacterium]
MTAKVDITKQFGAFELDMRFQVPPGVSAIFGPSGAGKTLTLRCIAGLARPDRGRIVVGERVLFDSAGRVEVPARQRRIGYVFQQYALFPHLDVAANVAYGLRDRTPTERKGRVEQLLTLIGLTEHAHHYPRMLSGGQQQRVALVRALAPEPDLVLLDEPFAAVDALTRRQLRTDLRQLQERTGVPMLLVTHDLADVQELATYVAICEQGRAVQEGPLQEVLSAPSSPGVAALLNAAGARQ